MPSSEPPPPEQVQWYHLDPDAPYQELRVDAPPGVTRALVVGAALAVAVIILMYVALWIGSPGDMMPAPN